MFKKNDPVVEAVKSVMEVSELHRQLEAAINEQFGVVSRNALPHEMRAAYDAALNEAKKYCEEDAEGSVPRNKEEEKLAALHGNKKRITHGDVLKGRGVIEEDEIDEASDDWQANRIGTGGQGLKGLLGFGKDYDFSKKFERGYNKGRQGSFSSTANIDTSKIGKGGFTGHEDSKMGSMANINSTGSGGFTAPKTAAVPKSNKAPTTKTEKPQRLPAGDMDPNPTHPSAKHKSDKGYMGEETQLDEVRLGKAIGKLKPGERVILNWNKKPGQKEDKPKSQPQLTPIGIGKLKPGERVILNWGKKLDEAKAAKLRKQLQDVKWYGRPDPGKMYEPGPDEREKYWEAEPKIKKALRAKLKAKPNLKEALEEAVSRKHFRDVANLLKEIPDEAKRKELAHHHAGIFAGQNPRFDKKKFLAAAGVKLDEETLWEEIKSNLEEQLVSVYESGDEQAFADYVASLTEEQLAILGLNEADDGPTAGSGASLFDKGKALVKQGIRSLGGGPSILGDTGDRHMGAGKSIGTQPTPGVGDTPRSGDIHQSKPDAKSSPRTPQNKGAGGQITDTPTSRTTTFGPSKVAPTRTGSLKSGVKPSAPKPSAPKPSAPKKFEPIDTSSLSGGVKTQRGYMEEETKLQIKESFEQFLRNKFLKG